MKNIKQIREEFDLITEKEENEAKKLSALVRAGLYDAKKLPALKKALDKSADKMTAQEKRMLINLLDALMSEVLSDKQVYRKIKQDVMMKEAKDNFVSDPRFGRGYPSQKDVPSVLLLKRKAIRVFPDGQKVALYYAQAIDKYVSIPFSEIGINEEAELDENLRLLGAVGGAALKYGDDAIKAIGSMAKGSVGGIASKGGEILSKGKEFGKKAVDSWRKSRADKAKRARDAVRRKEVKDLTKQRRVSGPRTRGGKKDRASAGGRLTTAANALSSALGTGGSSGSGSEPKYFTPMSQARHGGQDLRSAPQRVGSPDAYQKRIEIASRKASERMSQNESLSLDGNTFELNNNAATKVKTLYESLNKKNKKKMLDMMNESDESLKKVISFAVRQ